MRAEERAVLVRRLLEDALDAEAARARRALDEVERLSRELAELDARLASEECRGEG